LRRHAGRPLEALATDPDERWTVERGLQLCAQNALDIATHLAASADVTLRITRAPSTSSASLVSSPPNSAARFRGIAGFRNILVHGYLGVDLSRMHRLLNSGLDDFANFARFVDDYLRHQ
jgi:uncharacterized protein YutE (UPF0331/DUF86 family)